MSYEQSGKLLGLYDKLVECEIISTKEEQKNNGGDENNALFADMA